MGMCRNPVALGRWLYNQCVALGIEFRMNSQAVSARLSDHNRLQALSLMDKNGKQSTLKCDNLVLAAGPWTPVLFKTLFPQAIIKIEAAIDAGDWIIFRSPEQRSATSIAAVYFDEIVGEKLEFAGRNDQKVWATGEKSQIGTLPKPGDAPEPDEKALLNLLANATRFLKYKQGDEPGLHIIKQGRSFRPETPSRLPVITAVPGCKLNTQDTTLPSDDRRPSVFINSGHGSYGVTLGMGSGKVMSQIIMGSKPDVDLSKMGFSQ